MPTHTCLAADQKKDAIGEAAAGQGADVVEKEENDVITPLYNVVRELAGFPSLGS